MPQFVPEVVSGGNVVFSGGASSGSLSSIVFSNGNGVSFGLNGSTMTASAAAGGGGVTAAASDHIHGGFNLNLTNINASISSSSNGHTLNLSVPQNTVSVGGNSMTFGNLAFSNANGVTFGLLTTTGGSGTITASIATNQTLSLYAVGDTTLSTSGTAALSALSFRGDSSVSVGVSNGSVVFRALSRGISVSAGTQQDLVPNLVFSNSNGVTFGFSASTITASVNAGGGAGATISSYEPYPFQGTGTGALSLATRTSGPNYLFPFQVVENVSCEQLNIIVSMSFITGSTSAFSQQVALRYGLFSRPTNSNSTRLYSMLANTIALFNASYSNSSMSFTWQGATSNGAYGSTTSTATNVSMSSLFTGLKQIQLNMATLLTPGQYWLALHNYMDYVSFSSSGLRLSLYGNSQTLTAVAPMGQNSSAFSSGTNNYNALGGNWNGLHGSYSTNAATLATEISISSIFRNVTVMPYMRFVKIS
jgi:hypothetical protein